jgi:hypothetical protein
MSPDTYTYRWTGDEAVIIGGHTTPEGSGVLAEPGQNFSTIEPFDHPQARPVVDKKQKGEHKPETVQEDPSEETGE